MGFSVLCIIKKNTADMYKIHFSKPTADLGFTVLYSIPEITKLWNSLGQNTSAEMTSLSNIFNIKKNS